MKGFRTVNVSKVRIEVHLKQLTIRHDDDESEVAPLEEVEVKNRVIRKKTQAFVSKVSPLADQEIVVCHI